jgi:hypothetical protein
MGKKRRFVRDSIQSRPKILLSPGSPGRSLDAAQPTRDRKALPIRVFGRLRGSLGTRCITSLPCPADNAAFRLSLTASPHPGTLPDRSRAE